MKERLVQRKSGRSIAINNKKRGKGLEREVVKIIQPTYGTAQRAWGSDGKALGEHSEVDVKASIMGVPFPVLMQCKRKKKFPVWLLPSKNVHAQVIRADEGEAHIVLPLVLLLEMIRGAKDAHQT